MKRVVALFLLIVFSFSTLTFSVIANDSSVTLINKGEVITTTNPIIEKNGDYFISAEDLNLINVAYIYYDGNDYGLGKLNGPYKYSFNTETGILEYERVYENAVFVENDLVYVSLGALIDLYSVDKETNIDTENDILKFWINDYKTTTHWITYQIDTLIPIDEDGLEVTLYKGFKRNMVVAKGTGRFYPEMFEGSDLTDYPSETDVYNIGQSHTIKSSERHIFYDNARSYTIFYDEKINTGYRPGGSYSSSGVMSASSTGGSSSGSSSGGASSGGGSGVSINGSSTAGIKVDNGTYVGGVYRRVNDAETLVELQLDDVIECKTVSGSITIPTHTEDVEYTVIAKSKGGSTPTFIDLQSGIITADETIAAYELKLKPNLDYDITVRFTDNNFFRKSVEISDITSDKVVDFNDFVVSNEVTGRIKLPSDITSITDVYNNSLDTLYIHLRLQGSEGQHYIVDRKDIELSVEDGYADFVLRDDIGIENAIVSFRVNSDAREIFDGGVYYDNNTIKYIAAEGTPISTNTKDIVLNIAKGKAITIDVNCDVYSRTEMYLDIVRSEAESSLKDCPLYVEAMETDTLYEDENYTHTLRFTAVIPDEFPCYRPYMKDSLNLDYITYLGANNEWVSNKDYSLITREENLTTHYKGYDPATPIEITYHGESSDNGHVYDYYVDSLFDYDATIYVAYYGENNKLLHIESRPQTFESYTYYELYFTFDSTYEPLAEEIRMHVWTDKLRPLSDVVKMKPTE